MDADAGFCVLGLIHNLYEIKEAKRTRRQRLWSAIRYNPAQRWWNRLMHDRYCCGGYCAR